MSEKRKYFQVSLNVDVNVIDCIVYLTKDELNQLKFVRDNEDIISERFESHCYDDEPCIVCMLTKLDDQLGIKKIKKIKNCNIEVNAEIIRDILDLIVDE